MKLEFEKHRRERTNSALVTDTFRIFVDITAIPEVEEKIAYAVQNMAYSLDYQLTKKET